MKMKNPRYQIVLNGKFNKNARKIHNFRPFDINFENVKFNIFSQNK